MTEHPGLTLTTAAFPDGGRIPSRYTGSDPHPVSPRLEWTHVPAGTTSFALIMHDLDAAPNRGVDDILHWLVFNIPGQARSLAEGMRPGVQLSDGTILGKTYHGENAYLPPGAPAAGPEHHYAFELYALDVMLNLGVDVTVAEVLSAASGHVLGKAVLVGRFHL